MAYGAPISEAFAVYPYNIVKIICKNGMEPVTADFLKLREKAACPSHFCKQTNFSKKTERDSHQALPVT